MHEMGHVLGLPDVDAADGPVGVMTENLSTGTRREIDAAIKNDVACLSSLVPLAAATLRTTSPPTTRRPTPPRPASNLSSGHGRFTDAVLLGRTEIDATPAVLAVVDAEADLTCTHGPGKGWGRRSFK
jgi:hypothetical protein